MLTKCVWNFHWESIKTQKTDWIFNSRPGSAHEECMSKKVKKGGLQEQTGVRQ